jgi:hypothetical protein
LYLFLVKNMFRKVVSSVKSFLALITSLVLCTGVLAPTTKAASPAGVYYTGRVIEASTIPEYVSVPVTQSVIPVEFQVPNQAGEILLGNPSAGSGFQFQIIKFPEGSRVVTVPMDGIILGKRIPFTVVAGSPVSSGDLIGVPRGAQWQGGIYYYFGSSGNNFLPGSRVAIFAEDASGNTVPFGSISVTEGSVTTVTKVSVSPSNGWMTFVVPDVSCGEIHTYTTSEEVSGAITPLADYQPSPLLVIK